MNVFVVAVRDSAMNAFAKPIFVQSIGVATRSFSDEVNRKGDDNQLSSHPEDFELYQLGTFDEETGRFVNCEVPQLIVRGKDVSKQ